MPTTNADVIQSCVIVNWIGLAAFTIGGASLPSPPHNAWNWDTISQMVTRKQAVENGFAVFLTTSTIVLGTIIVSMIYRFEDAGLQGPYWKQQRFAIKASFSIAMIAMVGIGVASLAVDDDVHTVFAGTAFTLLWIGTTMLAYIHRKVQKYVVAATTSVIVGGVSMFVLAIYSTGSQAHARVQDNEAYFCEYILVTTMHIVLYSLASIDLPQKYNIHMVLHHGALGEKEEKTTKTLIL